MTNPSVTIVTTCKGRKAHLELTLETMMLQEYNGTLDVIVVDYGDPDGTYDWVANLNNELVRPIRILDNTAYFNLSRARNCGATFSSSDVLCFVDADMLLGRQWLSQMTKPLQSEAVLTYHSGSRKRPGMGGSIAVKKYAWEMIRGYDEAFDSYGSQRKDFQKRIEEVGATIGVKEFDAQLIDHDDQMRMEFYPFANKLMSKMLMRELLNSERASINPKGFGVALIEYEQKKINIANSQIL